MAEKKKELPTKCACGKQLTDEAASFWGECLRCRGVLPLSSAQGGDAGRAQGIADRRYHGGQFHGGEW